MGDDKVVTGRCLCGAVSYQITGPITDVHACHCGQCRRQSGHFVIGGGVRRSDFELSGAEHITWYKSSDWARRGFCSRCGSKLLWDDGGEEVGINVGSLDQPTGLKLERHIFVDDKADYYEIDDDLPKVATYE
ncbi:MAG: GFA family protein [Pseudomonadota bacterium]